MDLGSFAEEVLHVVAGICGDGVVETHEQAANVFDCLVRRPGSNRRELAAVFGVSLEQLERCRSKGKEEESQDQVYDNLCRLDAVYTWNVLIQRINQAAHWREEFRELWNEDDPEGSEDEANDENDETASTMSTSETKDKAASKECGGELASAKTRERARALMAKHIDAPEVLKRRLLRRLDDEIFEHSPEDKDYRHACRTIAANLRRNTMLAAGYAAGRVPPEWMVLCDTEALAPRIRQLSRRLMRNESLKESKEDDATAELRRRTWRAAYGTDLAPPPAHEDPYGEGKKPGAAFERAPEEVE